MALPWQADDQALIDVQVNQLTGARVQAEIVNDAGGLAARWRQREFEAETPHHVGEIGRRLAVDEQVDIPATTLPPLPFSVAFPLAIGDAALGQRRTETADQCGRRGRAGARRSSSR